MCEGSVIRPKDILVKQTWQPQATATVPNLEEVERRAIETAILQNNGNLTAAAEQLGVSRQTLYNKLKRIQLPGQCTDLEQRTEQQYTADDVSRM